MPAMRRMMNTDRNRLHRGTAEPWTFYVIPLPAIHENGTRLAEFYPPSSDIKVIDNPNTLDRFQGWDMAISIASPDSW